MSQKNFTADTVYIKKKEKNSLSETNTVHDSLGTLHNIYRIIYVIFGRNLLGSIKISIKAVLFLTHTATVFVRKCYLKNKVCTKSHLLNKVLSEMHKQYFGHLKGVTVHGINHDVCRKSIPPWRYLVFVFRSTYLRVLSPDPALCASLVHECCSPGPRRTLAHPSFRAYQVDPPDQGNPEAHENPQSHF